MKNIQKSSHKIRRELAIYMAEIDILESRIKNHLTQDECAKMCGIAWRSWGTYERRKRFPSYIRELFAVKLWLMGYEIITGLKHE